MARETTKIFIVKTIEELQTAYDIRRSVFIVEQDEPEHIEFDGNDLCSFHLLAYWKGKPAGTMRLRVVSGDEGGTIIWERLAILKSVREGNPWMFRTMLNNARQFTQLLGFTRIVGIVEDQKLMRIWKLYGTEVTGEAPINIQGNKYIPICLSMNDYERPNAFTLRKSILSLPDLFDDARASA